MKPSVANTASEVIAPSPGFVETWRLLYEEVARYKAKHPCEQEEHILDSETAQTRPAPHDEVFDSLIEEINQDLEAKTDKNTRDFHKSIANITYDLPTWAEGKKSLEPPGNPEENMFSKYSSSTEKDKEEVAITKKTLGEAGELPVEKPEDFAKCSFLSRSLLELPSLHTELEGFDLGYSSSSESATASDVSEDATESPATDDSCCAADQAFTLPRFEADTSSSPSFALHASVVVPEWTNGEVVADDVQEPSLAQPTLMHWFDNLGIAARLEAKLIGWFENGASVPYGHSPTGDGHLVQRPANPTPQGAKRPSRGQHIKEDEAVANITTQNSFLGYLLAEYDPSNLMV